MPGTIVINIRETYSAMILMAPITPKMKFGTDIPDVNAAGEAKYVANLAVSYRPEPGMPPQAEVITVTLTGGDRNQLTGIPEGSPVELEGLRAGVSAPEQRERRDGGTRVVGGKLYFAARGIRPVGQAQKAA